MYILKWKGKNPISVWLPWKPRLTPLKKKHHHQKKQQQQQTNTTLMPSLNFLCFGPFLYISFPPHVPMLSHIHHQASDLVQSGTSYRILKVCMVQVTHSTKKTSGKAKTRCHFSTQVSYREVPMPKYMSIPVITEEKIYIWYVFDIYFDIFIYIYYTLKACLSIAL